MNSENSLFYNKLGFHDNYVCVTIRDLPYSTGMIDICCNATFCATPPFSLLFVGLLELFGLVNQSIELICIEDKLLHMFLTNL